MQRSDVRGWISAILIIIVGACECLFRDFSSRPLQQSPADRSALVGKGNDLGGRRSCTDRGHASLSPDRRASLSHTRCCFAASMYWPMLARASSSITPSSRSSAMPAFANRGFAVAVYPMTFRCPKASRTQSIAALFLSERLDPLCRGEDRDCIEEHRRRA